MSQPHGHGGNEFLNLSIPPVKFRWNELILYHSRSATRDWLFIKCPPYRAGALRKSIGSAVDCGWSVQQNLMEWIGHDFLCKDCVGTGENSLLPEMI